MINTHESTLGQSVKMTELYDYLGLTPTYYSRWVEKELLTNPYLTENKDYCTTVQVFGVGRKRKEYDVHIDAAKKLCMVSKSLKGNEIRNELVKLTKKVDTGLLLSREQINFLFELVKVMGLFSVQNYSEKKHFELHNNKYDWWAYRAAILGYGTNQLKTEVEKLNHKYKSFKQALIHVDKYELIRIGVIDLFIALGKPNDYAENIANMCKDIAKQLKVDLWDDSESKNSIPFQVDYDKRLESKIKGDQLMIE